MKLLIKNRKEKPFTGKDGAEIQYFWYDAVKPDGTVISFGSKNGKYEVDEFEDVPLERYEGSDGRIRYRG